MKIIARLPCAATLALLATLASRPEGEKAATFDQLWSHATLYQDEQNPYFEVFKLCGRYQGQYWDVDAAQGSLSNWEDRRLRFGFDAKFFGKQVGVHLDFDKAEVWLDWLHSDRQDDDTVLGKYNDVISFSFQSARTT